jgi:transcriptional regulator with GAF, ATPase, and Fis domain/serine/threonine protein kinase/Tfp pilus assembly protein PilF
MGLSSEASHTGKSGRNIDDSDSYSGTGRTARGRPAALSQPEPGNPASATPELIADRYEVLSRLGGGELSEVYRVRDQIGNRILALKTTRPGVSREEELGLNREFYHLSRFNHPGIIAVRDFGTSSDGRHYFTMEFFDGKPVNEFFARGTTPDASAGQRWTDGGSLDDLTAVMVQVLQALDTIHCQGLLHCDIKPQNILVAREMTPETSSGSGILPFPRVRAKLLDFGFAERFALSNSREARGTLGYIAPEVFKGTGVDARSDIYSLGMVVYETLTGNGPSHARDLLSWLRLQHSGKLPRPRDCGVELPAKFEEVLWQMVQDAKEERPHSCLEIIERLTEGNYEVRTPAEDSSSVEHAPALDGPQNYLLASGFVGRSEFLGKLSGLLDGAAQAQGSLVFVSGERGVGKSRLVTEFKFLAQLEGATVYPFTPASLGARPQSLLESIIRYLKDYHRIDATTGIEGAGPAPESGNPGIQESSPRALEPFVTAELSPEQHLGEAEKFRLFETVAGYLRQVARGETSTGIRESRNPGIEPLNPRTPEPLNPLSAVSHSFLLLVDDFELFDPTSLEFLRYLVSSVEHERIMVVVAGLNERRLLELVSEFKVKPYVQHFALPNLNLTETRELTSSVLGDIPQLEELTHWLQASTGGNPLFVTEAIYSLIDKGILKLSASRWTAEVEELQNFKVPETVAEVIKRRLKRLAPDEMEILRIGAISGAPLTVEFMRVVLGYDERQLFSAVSRLKAMGLMRPHVGDTASSLILSSKMLESVVIETVGIAERRESHRRVALALELLHPDDQERLIFDLAHHYTQAGMKDRAYSYSLKAGERALGYHITEQALTYFETAHANAPATLTTRERLALIERLGGLRETLGRYREAIDIYMQGISLIVSDKQLAKSADLMPGYLRAIGLVHQKQDKHAEALQYFDQAAALRKGKADTLTIDLLNDMGWSHTAQGAFARAEKLYAQALELAGSREIKESGNQGIKGSPLESSNPRIRESFSSATTVRTRYYMAVLAWYQGETESALELVQQVIREYEDHIGEPTGVGSLSHLTQFAATLFWSQGRPDQARELYEKLLPLQRRSNDVFYLLSTLVGIAMIQQDASEWEGATRNLREAYDIAERIGDQSDMIGILNNLGIIREDLGFWDEAQEHYSRSQKLAVEKSSELSLVAVLGNQAALANRRGEFDEAERLLRDAQTIVAHVQQKAFAQALEMEQARLELRRDRVSLARQHIVRAYQLNHALQDRRQRPELRLVAAKVHVHAGEPEKALVTLRPLFQTGVKESRNRGIEPSSPRILESSNPSPATKTLLMAERIQGNALSALERQPDAVAALRRSVQHARELHLPYELGRSLFSLATVLTTIKQPESIFRFKPSVAMRSLTEQDLADAQQHLREAKEIFHRLGAKFDLQRTEELDERLTQLVSSSDVQSRHQSEYLRFFYELTEIINLGLDKEDFMDRILDLVIEVTGAERGLLFLVQNDRLITAAARSIDHSTLQDAQSISRSLLKQVKRKAEPVMTADALTDARFSASDSVSLNKIRSMLCVPLVTANHVVGMIYLDSRVNAHLFWEEDKSLLISVANLLAATIDKSLAFMKIQEDISTFREEILTDAASGYLLGKSPAMREVYQMIERIAGTDTTVLILGDTGSGKSVLARLIHNTGKRKAQRFVSINAGTLPETLFESELFGHIKGAFTGAVRDKEGLFETAEGGTVFLDEIANTSPAIQAKLLQAIEEKIIRRVGDVENRTVDVRMICATNRDLAEEVRLGRFREDLYYRMNVFTITVPPLSRRAPDIPHLAGYFLRRYSKELNKPILGFEEDAVTLMKQYPWPGNVRELQNVVERASIMCQKRKISAIDLGLKPLQTTVAPTSAPETRTGPAAASEPEPKPAPRVRSLQRDEVVQALIQTGGNVSEAAKVLNTHRRQVQRLMRRHGINKDNLG